MAKLHERPIIEEIDESSDPSRFDADLEKVLIAHGESADDFIQTVFGFVDRKTRFFKQGDASKKLAKLASAYATATPSGKGVKGGFFPQSAKSNGASKARSAALLLARCSAMRNMLLIVQENSGTASNVPAATSQSQETTQPPAPSSAQPSAQQDAAPEASTSKDVEQLEPTSSNLDTAEEPEDAEEKGIGQCRQSASALKTYWLIINSRTMLCRTKQGQWC